MVLYPQPNSMNLGTNAELLKTVFVMIGNSDDKLSQREWVQFTRDVDSYISAHVSRFHGEWYSLPNTDWQNACWCFEIKPGEITALKLRLQDLATQYRQDGIAWSDAVTVFLSGNPDGMEGVAHAAG